MKAWLPCVWLVMLSPFVALKMSLSVCVHVRSLFFFSEVHDEQVAWVIDAVAQRSGTLACSAQTATILTGITNEEAGGTGLRPRDACTIARVSD